MRDAFVEIDAPKAGRRETENGFYLVPLDGSAPRVYSLPPTDRLYYTHTVNAYENASGVVVDLCTLPGNPFVNAGLTVDGFRNKTARDAGEGTVVRRFLLGADGALTSENLTAPPRAADFPTINPAVRATKHCYFWAVEWWHDLENYASMALAKYDICGGAAPVHWHREDWYPSEPTFVAAPGASVEDDGVLVFVALDGRNGNASSLLVVDAATLGELSEASFPRIGFTTHGQFYADD